MIRFCIILFSIVPTLLLFQQCTQNNQPKRPVITMDTAIGRSFKVDLEVSKKRVDKEKAEEIKAIIEKLYKRHQFAGSVLIAEKGKIIFRESFGDADYIADTPLTGNTPFQLASVSKQFTAMSIMLLEAEGKLSFDDTVTRFIPEFPYKYVTIRQLLTHTSGVPPITNYIRYYLSFWDSCKTACNKDLVSVLISRHPRAQFSPGKRFHYNNTGYIILAYIVEKVSGLDFSSFLQKNIFKPLGMKNSFVYNIEDLRHKDRALGYALNGTYYDSNEDDIRNGLVGEKGVYSSVNDLFKWDRALRTEKLLKASTLKQAFTRGQLINGREINYGFGWRMLRKENNVVYHFGNWRGFRSAIIRVLDEDKTIIILNNTSSRKLRYIVRKVFNILYADAEDKPRF